MPTLTTPSVRHGDPTARGLWRFYQLYEGVSLVKLDGVWHEMLYPAQDDLILAEVYFLGGHNHTISDEMADELREAGYGDYIDTITGGYGSGDYGDGPYGG